MCFSFFNSDPVATKGDAHLLKRFEKFSAGQIQKLYVPLFTPIASQMRFFPSLTPFKFIFSKNEKKLRFTCPADKESDFDLKIHNCLLHIKRIELYSGRLMDIERRLSAGSPAKYFIKNQYARSWTVEAGLQEKRISDILLTDYLPNYIIIGMLEMKDLKGSRQSSNYNFQLFDLTSMYLKSGADTFPSDGAYQPEINTNSNDSHFSREFFSCYGSPALSLKSDSGSWIYMDDFLSGFGLIKFAFNRQGDVRCLSETILDQRQATSGLDLYLKFGTALPENIAVVVFTSQIEQFSIKKTESSLRDLELYFSL